METQTRALALLNFLRPHYQEPELEYIEIEIEDEEYESAINHMLESASFFGLDVPIALR